jgi:Amt family ammonium transporter
MQSMQDVLTLASQQAQILQLWWIVCATLVVLMIFGFIMIESGLVEASQRDGIAIKNICMFAAAALAYCSFGFSLMYGRTFHGVVGVPFTVTQENNNPAWQFYQTGFATIAAIIVSGAMAGRTTLFANVFCATLVAGFVYPIYGHWIWSSGGWLSSRNAAAFIHIHDYAGASAVHIVGGTAAFVGSWIAGPRRNQQSKDRSALLAATGVLILMIGWIGFNGGSVTDPASLIGASIGGKFDIVVLVGAYCYYTVLAGCSGLMSALLCSMFSTYRRDRAAFLFDQYAGLTGAMGGMVAITATCDRVDMFHALCVGAFGGSVTFVVTKLVLMWGIDDLVDASAVHVGGGVAGMLAAGLVSTDIHAETQVWGIVSSMALTAVVVGPALLLLRLVPTTEGGTLLDTDDTRYDIETRQRSFIKINRKVILAGAVVSAVVLILILLKNRELFYLIVGFMTFIALVLQFLDRRGGNGR